MTDSDADGIYECEIDSKYPNVIFTRNNPEVTELGWDAKWNQTINLTIPNDGKNCFIINSWDGGDEGKSTGTWSKK